MHAIEWTFLVAETRAHEARQRIRARVEPQLACEPGDVRLLSLSREGAEYTGRNRQTGASETFACSEIRLVGVFSGEERASEAAELAGRVDGLLRRELGDLALLPGQSRYEVCHRNHWNDPNDREPAYAVLSWTPTRWRDFDRAVQRSVDCAGRVLAVRESFAGALVLGPVEETPPEVEASGTGAADLSQELLFETSPTRVDSEQAYTHLCLSFWEDEEGAESAKDLISGAMLGGDSPVPPGWRVTQARYHVDHP